MKRERKLRGRELLQTTIPDEHVGFQVIYWLRNTYHQYARSLVNGHYSSLVEVQCVAMANSRSSAASSATSVACGACAVRE